MTITYESASRDAAFHLALEEYLFLHAKEAIVLLYRNDPSIIVGRYQNICKETRYFDLMCENIPVFRRMSGGGTVYHDAGNLNYSFIGSKAIFKDYESCLGKVIAALGSMGISAVRANASDLRVQGKKVSGNAQKISKDRMLHHGTLLFSTDLEKLRRVSHKKSPSYMGTATDSAISTVGNLKDMSGKETSIEEFSKDFLDFFGPRAALHFVSHGDNRASQAAERPPSDVKCDGNDVHVLEIEWEEFFKLREKYRSQSWIFGKTPPFRFVRDFVWCGEEIHLSYQVKGGVFVDFDIRGAGRVSRALSAALKRLEGAPYDPHLLREALRGGLPADAERLLQEIV